MRLFTLTLMLLTMGAEAALAQELPRGRPIDNDYRDEFARCDAQDIFQDVSFPIVGKTGKVIWFGCKTDPSRLTQLEKVTGGSDAVSAVVFTAKLAHDLDGSATACSSSKGVTDQCATSLMMDDTAATPCVIPSSSGVSCVPVDADKIPYVVIPGAAPKGIASHQFTKLTGVDVGDYGVVIANGKMVSVIVADQGPAYKIGEGSTALLKQLSNDGKARTISAGVTYVIFPGSRDRRNSLVPESLAAHVSDKAGALFKELVGSD